MFKPCTGCDFALETNRKKTKQFLPWSKECFTCEKYKRYLKYLESRRKYVKGDVIKSLDDFQKHFDKNGLVFVGDKIYSMGWVCSWQYRMIVDYIRRGIIRYAIKKK